MKKLDAENNPTRSKVRITAGYLVSSGNVLDTYSANLAGETPRYIAQLNLQMEGFRIG